MQGVNCKCHLCPTVFFTVKALQPIGLFRASSASTLSSLDACKCYPQQTTRYCGTIISAPCGELMAVTSSDMGEYLIRHLHISTWMIVIICIPMPAHNKLIRMKVCDWMFCHVRSYSLCCAKGHLAIRLLLFLSYKVQIAKPSENVAQNMEKESFTKNEDWY